MKLNLQEFIDVFKGIDRISLLLKTFEKYEILLIVIIDNNI